MRSEVFTVVRVSLAAVASLTASAGAEAPEPSMEAPFVSLAVGTQSIGVRYQFSSDSAVEESASQIAALGADTLKLALTPRYAKDYRIEPNAEIRSLMDLLRAQPAFDRAMGLPFRNIMLWVYPFADSKSAFATGYIDDEEAEKIYREIYDLTAYLLKRYSGSGKTFFLGNWEGDWHMLLENYDYDQDPTFEAIKGAIRWFTLRERAVADARRDTPHTNVKVHFYIELNHVRKAMDSDRPTIVNRVLPHIRTDFVSWSSYDVTKPAAVLGGEAGRALVFKALNYIEAHLPKSDLPGRRVFIGEYGFELSAFKEADLQMKYTASIMKWALEWGCPFVLYWELYCNEVEPATGKSRGYWLIDDQGVKQPVWFLHHEFLARGRKYLEAYRAKHGTLPSQSTYAKMAATWIEDCVTYDGRTR
ncbi:MAG: hypothetical protein JNN01_09085 [Opitutaceae bacterium]|nr:hypothetical protein [Opitutaceae bacterium]